MKEFENYVIKPLPKKNEIISSVSRILYSEFYRFRPDQTYFERYNIIKDRSCSNIDLLLMYLKLRKKIPVCFIIYEKGKKLTKNNWIGTISFVIKSLDNKYYTPWISSLYVKPDHRNKHISQYLLTFTEKYAVKLNYKTVYLFTDLPEKFYLKIGWKTIEKEIVNNHEVTIMKKNF